MGEIHVLDKDVAEALQRAEESDKEYVNKCYRWLIDESEHERIDNLWVPIEENYFQANTSMDIADFLLFGLSIVQTYTKEMNDNNKMHVLKTLASSMGLNMAIITSGDNNG